MRPSWASTVRKALAATLVAFTVAGGTVLAALADDHITTSEWVTIAWYVAGALIGGGTVYAVPNARRSTIPGSPAHVLAPQDDTDSARRPDWWTEPL